MEKTCDNRSFGGRNGSDTMILCKAILKISQADVPKGSEAGCFSEPFTFLSNTSFFRVPLGGISSFEANSYSGVVSPSGGKENL